MVVEGPPGIGKTSLLAIARERARSRGTLILAGRGGELEGHFPYGVVRQLFEPLLHRASASRRRELLSGPARLAAPLVAGDGTMLTGQRGGRTSPCSFSPSRRG